MDQPFSRAADGLLDRQYWSPDDPQKHPYDDTGWTFGEMFGVETVRTTDASVLEAPSTRVTGPLAAPSAVKGSGSVHLVAARGDDATIALRYALGDADVQAATESFQVGSKSYPRGTWIVRGGDAKTIASTLAEKGISGDALGSAPTVATLPVGKPRIALLHSWLGTQTEGWWRQRLDLVGIPYDYISTQDVAADADLSAKYDVILFPPVDAGDPQRIVTGLPMWGEPLPWKVTALTPNLGHTDETDDMRPGLGFSGLDHLRAFVENGGLLIAVDDTARLLVRNGLAPGVRVTSPGGLKVVGSLLDARFPDASTPLAIGVGDRLSVYSAEGMSFELSNSAAGAFGSGDDDDRPTGRGTAKDSDVTQGRKPQPAPEEATKVERWEARPLSIEELRHNPSIIPADRRPRTLVRFGDADGLLISGLLDKGGELAKRAAVVDVPVGKGHLLLFAINPIWRGETIGSHPLVWNAILHRAALSAPPAAKAEAAPKATEARAEPDLGMSPAPLRFDRFVFHPESGELGEAGAAAPIRLEPQPARVLAVLLRRSGEVVSREELQREVWPADTFVDFERGLTYCVGRIRSALGDDAAAPRFVEDAPAAGLSVPGADLRGSGLASADAAAAFDARADDQRRTHLGRLKRGGFFAIAVALLAVTVVILRARHAPPTVAVALFDNETGRGEFDPAAQRFTDAVVERLARTPATWAVIGNAAVLRTPRPLRNLQALAAALDADFFVIGQIQPGERGFLVLTHLIRAGDLRHLWVGRIETADPLDPALPAEIAERVAGALAKTGPATR
jgi:DNA-binding winged helix-turn-helix (wHTH) protein/TolB-like protein